MYEDFVDYEEMPERIIRYPGKEVTCLIFGIVELTSGISALCSGIANLTNTVFQVLVCFITQLLLFIPIIICRIIIDTKANYTTGVYKVGSILALIGYGLCVLSILFSSLYFLKVF